jgi:adenylate cyclase, class 2
MLEVEIRYRYADRAALVARLTAWGATRAEKRTDIDHYFNAPDRDFRATDEAFRLRRVGSRNCLTYKGPRRDAETKTRTEIELPLAEGDSAARTAEDLLMALRFRPVVIVRKQRTVYRFVRGGFPMEACFDDLENVGAFIELEILAEEPQYEAAKAVLMQTATELGLTEKETRSYLGMVLEAQPKGGETPAAPAES